MKMQEAQALADIPLEETIVSESSEDEDQLDQTGKDSIDYDEEMDKEQEQMDRKEVEKQIKQTEMKIKRARYASQGRVSSNQNPQSAASEQKVYGGGQPIVAPNGEEDANKKKNTASKICQAGVVEPP